MINHFQAPAHSQDQQQPNAGPPIHAGAQSAAFTARCFYLLFQVTVGDPLWVKKQRTSSIIQYYSNRSDSPYRYLCGISSMLYFLP